MSGDREPVSLCCVLCLYTIEGVAEPADTVVEGYAVCYHHLPIVAQGNRFSERLRQAKVARDERGVEEE